MSNTDSTIEIKKKRNKWLKTAIWIIGMAALTVGMVYLIWFLESYLRVPVKQYAPLAYLIVFVATFLSSCTIVFPAPGMAIVMAAASTWNPALVAIVASIGGTLGELTAYYAGYLGNKMIVDENQAGYNWAVSWMNKYGVWAIFLFALIPMLLFDLVGLAAGVLRFPVWKFLLACWGGRIPRSFVEAYVGAGILPLIFPTWFIN